MKINLLVNKCVEVGGSFFISEGIIPTSGRDQNGPFLGFYIGYLGEIKSCLSDGKKVLSTKSHKSSFKVRSFHLKELLGCCW